MCMVLTVFTVNTAGFYNGFYNGFYGFYPLPPWPLVVSKTDSFYNDSVVSALVSEYDGFCCFDVHEETMCVMVV